MWEKKIKKPQEKLLGIQTKTAKTGSGNRIAVENKAQHRSNQGLSGLEELTE